jgi:general stress protein YciG
MSEAESISKRGLASASGDTRKRVARAGGEAPHEQRGLQAADWETRREVARKGGLARGLQRRKAKLQNQEEILLKPIPA